MSDTFYSFVVTIGRLPFFLSARPHVLHVDRVPRTGALIIASTHMSPYDVPLLMRHTPRHIDFVSITEIFAMRFPGWFYGNMNAFPLDRHRADPKTVKIIVDRLGTGRVVGLFPEGRIKSEADSVVHGAPFKPGVARIARMTSVPIVPVVVLNSVAYQSINSWLPLRRIRYSLNYGHPITVQDETEGESKLAQAYKDLYAELKASAPARRTDTRD